MKKLIIALILVIVLQMSAQVTQVRSTSDELVYDIEFRGSITETPEFSCLDFDYSNWSLTDIPGAPALPYRQILIAVPPQGDLSFFINVQRENTIQLNESLCPAPTILAGDKSSDFLYNPDPELYAQFPRESVQKEDSYLSNGYKIIPLIIYPALPGRQQNTLLIREEMQLKIKITGNTDFRSTPADSRAWLDEALITNYQQSKFWRLEDTYNSTGIDWQNSQFWYKIELAASPENCLNASHLRILPAFADYNDLRLFGLEKNSAGGYQKQQIPLKIAGEKVCFEYAGDNKVLWLALGGTFAEAPQRSNTIFDNPSPVQGISSKGADLRSNRNTGCILIRPQDYFETQSEELVQLHLEHFGIESAIVIQEDIFAQYAGGIAEPEAIKTYLEEQFYLNPVLEYVILLGSGTSDFDATTAKNKIITYSKSYFASDDNFVDFNNDTRPELVIGRIPAQSQSMMSLYLERLSGYLNEHENGWWQNRILFVADDENKKGNLEGATSLTSGMNHTMRVEDAALLVPDRQAAKVYGINYPFDTYKNKPGVTEDMISNINDGVAVTYYLGHGSFGNLGDEGYFSVSDLNFLQNSDHLTHFVAGSCNVGHFDLISNDCLSERFLFADDGGAICSIAASELSGPVSNSQLLSMYLELISNYGYNVGKGLVKAKIESSASITNSSKYNIMGDPLIYIPLPQKVGSISGLPDSLLKRQTVQFSGDFGSGRMNTGGETIAYDSSQMIYYSSFIAPDTTVVYNANYLSTPKTVFRSPVEIQNGQYSAAYIVPDDAKSGVNGKIVTLAADDDGVWINSQLDIVYTDSTLNGVENSSEPQVNLYLDSRSFRSGDAVNSSPLLIADIADDNGINLSGSAGRAILALIDDSNNPDDLIDVTDGFIYDQDSYTSGSLNWQLQDLDTGSHNLKLIVYDNFGKPAVAQIEFRVVDNSDMITSILPYPNPMDSEGWFTFVLTRAAQVSISIYTISGRKINTISSYADMGYNQIKWDCRDADGDRIANNNYFYKIRAVDSNGQSDQKTGKLIILH